MESAVGPVFLFVYLLALFLPGTFGMGPIRLTPFKLVLLLAFVPLALRWIQGLSGRITLPDLLFLGFCVWVSLATLAVHGRSQIFYVGSTFVEYFGAYLTGRIIIRNADDYRRLFRYFLIILLIMLPFALVETLTRIRLLQSVMGVFLSQGSYPYENAPRLGLTRVAVGFNHPILWGIVCGLGFANIYYLYKDRFLRRIQATVFVAFMTFLSISSGPLLALGLQGLIIAWDHIMHMIRSRWIIAAVLGVTALATLQILLPGGIVGYIVNEVIFNPYGGQTRITAFQYGTAEVLRHPLFGIGLNEYVRPWWEHSSIDNFWLVIPLRHGLPALVLLVLAIGVSAFLIMTQPRLDERESRCRTGYIIALVGLVLALTTVHIWAGALAFVMTYIGAGVWFYAGKDPDGEISRMQHERRSLAPEKVAGRPAYPTSSWRRTTGPGSPVVPRGGLHYMRTYPTGTNRTIRESSGIPPA